VKREKPAYDNAWAMTTKTFHKWNALGEGETLQYGGTSYKKPEDVQKLIADIIKRNLISRESYQMKKTKQSANKEMLASTIAATTLGGQVSSSNKSLPMASIAAWHGKLKMRVDGEIICPYLGTSYPRGNMFEKTEINKYDASGLPRSGRMGGRVASSLYNEKHAGFYPTNWHFHIGRQEEGSWLLLPAEGDKEGQAHTLYVHRSRNVVENSYLYDVTKTLIKNHPLVRRNGKGWEGGSWINDWNWLASG